MKKPETILTLLSLLGLALFFSISLHKVDADDEIVDEEDIPSVEEIENATSSKKMEVAERIYELMQRKIYLKWRLDGIDLEDDITAESYFVADLTDGEYVLAKKNDKESYPLASITKLMSAVITAENIDEEERIVLTPSMLKTYGYSPSLFPGAEVHAKDLMKVSLIQSTNDAAESLTYFMDKGVFVGLMNIKAHQIGMENSFFYDAHGLSPKNISSSADIVKLLDYINKEHPEIFEITCEEDFQLPNPYGRYLTFKNLNIFPEIPGFIGGKTGYLPEAKQTYTTIFELNGKTYALAILRSDNRKEDVNSIYQWLKKNPEFKD